MIKVDWRAYFREFCEKHGRHPVEIGNRLVFPDGWSYARNSYEGPEWPPPADVLERRGLLRAYWKRRVEILKGQRDGLAHALSGVAEQQLRRDARLMMVGVETYTGEDGRDRLRLAAHPADWEAMHVRLRHLDEDLKNSEIELLALDGLVITEAGTATLTE